MGIYTEYLEQNFDFNRLSLERKKQLEKISHLRGGREVLVYAADLTPNGNFPIAINFSDILPFQDQLSNLNGNAIDIILETPGGQAEVVEDIVKMIRSKYDHVGIIVPGSAKSAGTIFAMAADEIFMSPSSSLGPIDAQILQNNKQFSAEGYLKGFEKIKQEVETTKKLNPAYLPMLQNISPGELQRYQNAQDFSQILVTQWLSKYKFKYWTTHSSSGEAVTDEQKEQRAKEIASTLCNHSEWLTHSRSLKIDDFKKMGLQINDYSTNTELNEAITRYYTLLRMTLESTNMYKLFETQKTQVYKFGGQNPQKNPLPNPNDVKSINLNFTCQKCKNTAKIQANFIPNTPLEKGATAYPKGDNFYCPKCHYLSNLSKFRLQVEAQFKKTFQY